MIRDPIRAPLGRPSPQGMLGLSASVERTLLSKLFEAIPDACVVTDRDGRIIGASRIASGLLGLSRKLLAHRRLESFVPAHERRLLIQNLERACRGERVPHWDLYLQRPGRPQVHTLAQIRGILDRAGQVVAVGWSLRESWESKRGGIGRPAMEETCGPLADEVLNIPTVGFMVLDPKRRIRWINSTLEGFFSVEESALIGRDYVEALRALLGDSVFDPSDSLARAARGDEFECHMTDPNTMQGRWLKHLTVPAPSGGAFEVYRDITAEKDVQYRLLESVRAGALGVEIGAALNDKGRLRDLLRHAAQALAKNLNLLTARIWLLEKRRGGFVLAASVGEDLGLPDLRTQALVDLPAEENGTDSDRFPMTARQLEWAEDRGLIWHRQPIRLNQTTVGVITALSRQPLSPLYREALCSTSDTLALAIRRTTAETKVRDSRVKLARLSAGLRALTERLMTAEEQERRRVSRELHDDLGQSLAMLVMEVGTLAHAVSHIPGACESLEQLRDKLVDLSDQMRRVAHHLHPSILDDLGLVPALESYVGEFSRRERIHVEFKANGVNERTSKEVAACLYRIMQEGLRNVAKHARVRSVRVSLSTTSKGARLSIRDLGVGFHPRRDGSPRRGLGLISIRERVRMVKGRLIIRSRPGRGTHVLAWVPLSPPASGR